MITTRKAAVLKGKGHIEVEQIPVPKIGPDDVLVNVKAVGICGSDIHYYKFGKIGPYIAHPGHIVGHECAGIIAEVGSNVKNRKVGDRVAVEPGYGCGKCEFCKEGKYNLCLDMMFFSHPDPLREGAMAEYVVTPADTTFILPENMTFGEGAMMEPLAVALHALNQGGVGPGMSVAILGSGPIGFSMLLACQAYGCAEVYMTDTLDYRLECMRENGAAGAYNVLDCDWVKEINDATGGKGVDVVIEAAGSEDAYRMCTSIVKRGGTLVFAGMTVNQIFPMNVFDITDKELTITSIFRYRNVYQQGINMASSGKIDMKKLITHSFPIEEVSKAMEIAHEKQDNVVKIILTF